jgi:hypothetical protein
MINIENFGYLVTSSSQQNRHQITMSTSDAQALLNDIISLQQQLISAQQTTINTLERANAPVSGSMEVDSGKF